MKKDFKRRTFLRNAAALAALVGIPGCVTSRKTSEELVEAASRLMASAGKPVFSLRGKPMLPVRAALIGLGNRGSGHAETLNQIGTEKVKITAICDVQEKKTKATLDWLAKNGGQKPAVFTGKLDAWRDMLKRDDIDLVVISTPWEDHVPMSVEAMQAGTPVIVSDAGGNVEVVTHGQNGWVVPKGDEAALANTLIEVLRDPAEAARRVNAAIESLDRFSWPHLVDEYEAALKNLEPQRCQEREEK